MPSQHNRQSSNRELPRAENRASVAAARLTGVRSKRLQRARKPTPEVVVILAYVLITRLSLGNEANYGIWIGSVPIFPTDVTLILLVALTLRRRRAWFQRWIITGKGTGAIGRAIWCLCILAIAYAVLAWPTYHILALRDLAMFGYSLFFPLTYVAIRDRKSAIKITQYLVYGALIPGAALATEVVTGWNFGLLPDTVRFMTPFGALQRVPAGDLGSNLGFSLAALLSYLLLKKERRWINIAAALVCLIVISASLSRSAVLSVAAAAPLTLLFVERRKRVVLASLCGVAVLLLMGHFSLFQDLTDAVKMGITIFDDPDFQFRLIRWAEAMALWLAHPVLGAGFGVQICSSDPGETGIFNVGLPHNSYLTLLARTGIVGLGLFLFCYGKALLPLLKNLRSRGVDADSLAVANLLIAMGVFAGFNLFLEEPLLIAPFWIILAVACRLSEISSARLALARPRTSVPISPGGPMQATV